MRSAAPVGVANCNALHVGFAQETQHDAESLGANANESDVDLIIGGDVIKAAQDAAWNDGEAGGRSGRLRQEVATRERTLKRIA
jgi:hypothetical protein